MLKFKRLLILCSLFITMNLVAQEPVDSSTPLTDSLEKKLTISNVEDSNRINTLLELTSIYLNSDLDKAYTNGMKANELSKKIGYALGEARSLGSLGSITGSQGKNLLADSFLNESDKIFIVLKREDRLARNMLERGNLYFIQGNYWLAGDYYTKAIEGFEKQKDTAKTIIAYQNLVAVLIETKYYERAIEMSEKILPSAEKSTDSIESFYVKQGLMQCYIKTGNLVKAETYIKSLLDFSVTPDYTIAIGILGNVGDFYIAKNNNKQALVYFNKALQRATEAGDQFLIANMLYAVGSLNFETGNKDSALYYYKQAMEVAELSQNLNAKSETTKFLSEYYADNGNEAEAYRYLKQHLQLKDSILGTDVRNHLSYLEAKYESNKKEKQITELELSNAEKELAVAKRNQLLLTGGISAAAIVLLLGMLYRNSNHRKTIAEKEQKLQQEQIKFLERQQQVVSLQSMVNGQETERTRIAKDLHDGLGGLFSTVKMYFSTLEHQQEQLKDNDLFKKSYEMVDTAASEVRRIAHNMMPEVLLKLGLANALKDLCDNMSAGRLLQVSLQINGMEKRLNPSTEIMLYRIVQELLNNIVKHAQASKAIVQFIQDNDRLSVTVEDDGQGFNTADADAPNKAGIETVRSRVNYLNGNMQIDSQKDVGTTVMMDFLVNANPTP